MTTNKKSSKKAKNASLHMDAKTIKLSDTTSFKKSFLKNGWGVKTKNGQWFTVTKITGYGTAFVNAETDEVISARQWNSVMKHKTDKDLDIVLVAQPCNIDDFIEKNFESYAVAYIYKETKRYNGNPKRVSDV